MNLPSLVSDPSLAKYHFCGCVLKIFMATPELQMTIPREWPKLCPQLVVNIVNKYKATSFILISNVTNAIISASGMHQPLGSTQPRLKNAAPRIRRVILSYQHPRMLRRSLVLCLHAEEESIVFPIESTGSG